MEMKMLLLGVGLGALVSMSAFTTPAQTKQTTPAVPPNVRRGSATPLREYQWKLRTEVQRKGETKSVQVAQVRYDANGQMQTTLISKTPEPDLPKFGLRKAIAEKKFKEFKETVQQLGDLARGYSNLPADQMQHFMASAVISPELQGEQKLLRAEGHDVFQNGDTMVVWLDAVTRKQRRIEIQAAYDGKAVRIVSEFRDLPQGGPTYLATSQIAYDGGEVVIVTTNFDHERLRAETAVAAPAAAAAPAPAAASATAAGPIVTDNGWPRKFAVGGSSFAVYQPQMEQWEGNQWLGRAAFSVANGSAAQPSYGVLWFAGRTEIDKAKRLVSFSDIRVTRVSFPAAPDKASLLQSALQSHAQQHGEAIALDRLLAEMAANDTERASSSVGYNVKNDPP